MIQNFRFIGLGGVAACINLSTPFLLGKLIDYYHAHNQLQLSYLLMACSGLILAPSLKLVNNIYLAHTNSSTRMKLKQKSLEILIKHNKNSPSEGDIIEYIDNDTDNSIYLHHSLYYDVSTSLTAIIIAFIAIFSYQPSLSIAPTAAILFASLICFLTQEKMKTAYGKYIEENTSLISKILSRTKTKDRPLFTRFKKHKALVLHTLWCTQLNISSLNAISGLSSLIGLSAILYIGSTLITANTLTLGELIASTMYIDRILIPLRFLVGIYFSTPEAFYRHSRVRLLHKRDGAYD
ncbi:ABC transporter ATP-binding protein [Pseudomonas sp. FEN]|uniref:ABC transporter ATP-binding protein n=1 Tax=Pseudomonas sp. FEN TaxID=2767468 RepID=UPI00174A7E86|nr:ABC transporter ATP-binding protein [Pseudomonas sp. FEN]CAD5199726.1 hypothetical protein [Pseudomonas sp. FEN]